MPLKLIDSKAPSEVSQLLETCKLGSQGFGTLFGICLLDDIQAVLVLSSLCDLGSDTDGI